ncbi:LysR family transcriptional regulator [Rummeliibacillus sp. TYF-LIM-RU47]|uniref:LysR family transcriptional regulator n=1 Tax=Rummeliibacillus sp. TYF-LIM-RU47 TaxID=2608406 RepID=UPI00123A92C0|nr:LysR family transcriptional regulator [Rummeliibacillus sp. TYF-LIM-RU47]
MELRELKYFIAVVKNKSFTKAAEDLHVTQPTLSKVVKSLESEFDAALFYRYPRHIELTDVGEIVYAQALKMLSIVEELDTALEDVLQMKKGTIKIGMPPLIGILYLPKLLKGFQERYPHISIELVERGANIIKELVADGVLDIGFVMLPADENDFQVIPFASQDLMLIINKSHHLAGSKEISLRELANERMLLFSQDFTLHDRIKQECEQAGFAPQIAYESSQWDIISQMVEYNLGVAMFPKSFAEKINQEKVKAIPIVKPQIPWDLVLIAKKDRYISHATRGLIGFITSSHSNLE